MNNDSFPVKNMFIIVVLTVLLLILGYYTNMPAQGMSFTMKYGFTAFCVAVFFKILIGCLIGLFMCYRPKFDYKISYFIVVITISLILTYIIFWLAVPYTIADEVVYTIPIVLSYLVISLISNLKGNNN